jgi:transcriptional regulator with XRE-family HTH domain
MGTKWSEYRETLLTSEERAEIDLKVAIIGALFEARKEKGITQKELERISGVKQPLIARIENGNVDPQLTTILRMIKPLGYTLAIVPDVQQKATIPK